MFLFKLSSWLDRYDPYWHSRLMSLKIVVIAIVLFMVNALTQPLLSPLFMLIAGAGALIIEMPTINTLDKKDNVYLGYILLMCITVGLFSSYVILRGWFIVAVAGWAYILYMALKKAPQLYAIVSVVIMLGVMAQEGLNLGNFYIILNELAFILEFAFFIFWTHKLYPRMYHNIWFSSILRSLETLQKALKCGSISIDERQLLFKHFQTARSSIELLRDKPYLREVVSITNWLSYYHYYLPQLLEERNVSSQELNQVLVDLARLEAGVRNHKPILINLDQDLSVPIHHEYFNKLTSNWNKLCAPVTN